MADTDQVMKLEPPEVKPPQQDGPYEEPVYTKKDPRQHVYDCPDAYCGSLDERTAECQLAYDTNSITRDTITYKPAFLHMCDELIVNATDQTQLTPECNTLKFTVDVEGGSLTVWNNGPGIPVKIHATYGVSNPELIFGHMLTSSNYDKVKKTTGGKNGYGAKLTNIFSARFRVETCDGINKYVGVWAKNMTQYNGGKITPVKPGTKPYTRITFYPDFERLGIPTGFAAPYVHLLCKRVMDVAATTRVKVYWQGARVDIPNLKRYVELANTNQTIYLKLNDRWEIAVGTSGTGEFEHMSYVNHIHTPLGGTHVKMLVDQILTEVGNKFRAKTKGVSIRRNVLQRHLFFAVNAFVEDPSFSAQTKEELTTFIPTIPLPEKFIDTIVKKKLLSGALEELQGLNATRLKQSDGKKTSRLMIPKLDDANKAGTAEAHKCTLILTEGDSAKALAVAGVSEVGRDYFGIFPMRGKVLNVRGATIDQLLKNKEFNALKKIMGLKQGVKYENTSTLRYGRIMIFGDADEDGSHIKGLVINIFAFMWPELITMNGFLCEFVTPVIRCEKGKELVEHYSLDAYKEWEARIKPGSQWDITHLKGLGSSEGKDAKRYFRNLKAHTVNYRYDSPADMGALEMVFGDNSDRRKQWLSDHKLDQVEPMAKMEMDDITYEQFVNQELVLFSHYDNERSIPHLMDGLKPCQRKTLWTMMKLNLTQKTKCATIAGQVIQKAAYHHGETSLHDAIRGMANNFTGSNNLNLLYPAGSFGTRLENGKDSAQSRYVNTYVCPYTFHLFDAHDLPILKSQTSDGHEIEPQYFAPMLPMILINGASGIGTGFSTNVPCYNPKDLMRCIVHMLQDKPEEELPELVPWYRGFTGTIEEDEKIKGQFICKGKVTKLSDTQYHITEIPIDTWITPYKDYLKTHPLVSTILKDKSNESQIDVKIVVNAKGRAELTSKNMFRLLGLTSKIHTSNMVLFGVEGKLRRYDTPVEILKEYVKHRLELFEPNKQYRLRHIGEQKELALEKYRFIHMVIEDQLVLKKRPKSDVVSEMTQLGFQRTEQLLAMNLVSLTAERLAHLAAEAEMLTKEYETLKGTSVKALWRQCLAQVIKTLPSEHNDKPLPHTIHRPLTDGLPPKRRLMVKGVHQERGPALKRRKK